jgi:hypothetical protein
MNVPLSDIHNLLLSGSNKRLYFCKKLLAFERKRIKIYVQLGQQINQRIYPSFCLQKFIKHHYLSFLKDAISALKRTSFVADHITAFFCNPLYFVKCILCEFHFAFLYAVFKIIVNMQLAIFRPVFKISFSTNSVKQLLVIN